MNSFDMIRQTIERSNRRSGPEERRLPTTKDPERRITETSPKKDQGGDSTRWIKSLHKIWDVIRKVEADELSAEEALEQIESFVMLALEVPGEGGG